MRFFDTINEQHAVHYPFLYVGDFSYPRLSDNHKRLMDSRNLIQVRRLFNFNAQLTRNNKAFELLLSNNNDVVLKHKNLPKVVLRYRPRYSAARFEYYKFINGL